MIAFADAAARADATGMPAVQGFAVHGDANAGAAARDVLAAHYPGVVWETSDRGGDWVTLTPAAAGELPLGTAWQAVREMEARPGIETAEPLLLARAAVTNGADAGEHFRLWGRVSADRQEQIRRASGRDAIQWSLKTLRVPEAWAEWHRKRGSARQPGDGVLVAHPDTGYTRHPRVLRFLHDDGAGNRGTNFVERQANGDPAPDAFDPMTERALGHFPGHGTGTASVIAAADDDPAKPWGVAPGATVLPLRVSTSVIHLSFQNVCDAFDEAIRQKADVISMSLGGPVGSALLNDRVSKALDAGIIVVSAAGNYAPTVVFPAKVPGVIACAASNALDAPWRFSGMGGEVAVTAPGELVWHDTAAGDPSTGPFDESAGSGTSFATAGVAGLAALWLSYWGRDELLKTYGGDAGLIPFGFRHALATACDAAPKFVRGGGFGNGIVRADKLLGARFRPTKSDAARLRQEVLERTAGGIVRFPVSSWWSILTLPTLSADGTARLPDAGERDAEQAALRGLLGEVLGEPERFAGGRDLLPGPRADLRELATLAAADVGMRNAAARAAKRGDRGGVSPAALRRYLLRPGIRDYLSTALRDALEAARKAHLETWVRTRPELAAVSPHRPATGVAAGEYAVPQPPTRRLRAYAFDPSLATRSDAVTVNEITIPVVFETRLEPGPVGDYLAVIDVDPASDCAYAPVDLNHPFLLAQDGLPRSEGNPQFHQQMVYAVAMKTIRHFEEALGRPLFWSPLRPWDRRGLDRAHADPGPDQRDQFVQRLRLYPHALREQNAYYSPQKRAILFGYFPAGDDDPGAEYPGGIVFTCLAHDIIAHEMTHAILDGMHVHYTDPTNPDVFAFHEAFADIVALFQRFTYPELLRDQIARARGRLDAGTLMTRLALQFGQATGRRQALRDALGFVVRQEEVRRAEERERGGAAAGDSSVTIDAAARDFDDAGRGVWKRFHADPALLARVEEPHARGSFLVAAVFDAYLTIYEARVADLKRIASGGTGVLPDGDLHTDLVNRMADEAAKAAAHVLKMCVRAMDYVPPVDITFGEFLRALVTADSDLVPDDDRRYRVAFIEAFRKWGIYPRDVRTLSEESLRWSPPHDDAVRALFPLFGELTQDVTSAKLEMLRSVRGALLAWQPGQSRQEIFDAVNEAQARLQTYLRDALANRDVAAALPGIDLKRSFQVANLRPARRIGPGGEFLTEMVFEVLQRADALPYDPAAKREEAKRRRQTREEQVERGEEAARRERVPFRGGVTVIVGLDDLKIRYAIYKRRDNVARQERQREFLLRASGGDSEAAEYSTQGFPDRWYSDKNLLGELTADRAFDREAMRASSCACRRGDVLAAEAKKAAERTGIAVPDALTEPFALLHRP